MPDATRFARRTYRIAALYGLVTLLPHYALEQRIGQDAPPPITHPEYFYGFIGVALVWQFAFLLIARDPIRYRALMPVTWLEKLSFGVAALVLWALGRTSAPTAIAGGIDLVLAAAFATAFARTPRESPRDEGGRIAVS